MKKRYYEIVTVFAPTVAEDKLQNYISKIKSIINSCDGVIDKEENWGNRKLAYEIKKFTNGIYYFIACYIGKTSFVEELKKFFLTNEDIIRYGIKKIEKKKETTTSSLSTETGETQSKVVV